MLLTIRDLHKSFETDTGPVPVLNGCNLDLAAGETLALTGESGSGKSTLLHIAGGLEPIDSGQVLIDGRDIVGLDDAGRAAMRRTDVSVIFQQFNLIPSLDVAANIAFQARLGGNYDAAVASRLAQALGLGDLLHRYSETLSGGQQQRVAIARALAVRPKVILADEPTGNLDEDTADNVLATMLNLIRDEGTGLLMVTHSERIAARLDRRVHLSRGQLRVVAG